MSEFRDTDPKEAEELVRRFAKARGYGVRVIEERGLRHLNMPSYVVRVRFGKYSLKYLDFGGARCLDPGKAWAVALAVIASDTANPGPFKGWRTLGRCSSSEEFAVRLAAEEGT